jgi:hypothetical protein
VAVCNRHLLHFNKNRCGACQRYKQRNTLCLSRLFCAPQSGRGTRMQSAQGMHACGVRSWPEGTRATVWFHARREDGRPPVRTSCMYSAAAQHQNNWHRQRSKLLNWHRRISGLALQIIRGKNIRRDNVDSRLFGRIALMSILLACTPQSYEEQSLVVCFNEPPFGQTAEARAVPGGSSCMHVHQTLDQSLSINQYNLIDKIHSVLDWVIRSLRRFH